MNIEWNVDGHEIVVKMAHDKFLVSAVPCSNESSPASKCFHQDLNGCLVEYFVNTYGIDVQEGSAEVKSPMKIGWAVWGESSDIDLVVFMFIPEDDETFRNWVEAAKSVETTEPVSE